MVYLCRYPDLTFTEQISNLLVSAYQGVVSWTDNSDNFRLIFVRFQKLSYDFFPIEQYVIC